MVDRASPALGVSRQSVLLGVSRRSVYYTPQGESDFNLELMRRMGRAVSAYALVWLASDGSRLAADGVWRGPQTGAPGECA